MPRTPIFGLEEVEPFPVPKRPAMMQQRPSVKIPLKQTHKQKTSNTCVGRVCQIWRHYSASYVTCWWHELEGEWLQTDEHRHNNHQLTPQGPPWRHSSSPAPRQPLPLATPIGLSENGGSRGRKSVVLKKNTLADPLSSSLHHHHLWPQRRFNFDHSKIPMFLWAGCKEVL